jgi:hypothetical protein
MSVMHGKHLIEFVRPTAEVIAGAIVALCLLADASKHRKANTSVTDRIEFTPNRRATAAWLIMAAYFVYLVPVQFRRMGGNLLSVVTAVCFASIAIALLTSFPGTILIDSRGLQQKFWARRNKRIRWADIVEINTGERSRTVTITGTDGTKIVHSRQFAGSPTAPLGTQAALWRAASSRLPARTSLQFLAKQVLSDVLSATRKFRSVISVLPVIRPELGRITYSVDRDRRNRGLRCNHTGH